MCSAWSSMSVCSSLTCYTMVSDEWVKTIGQKKFFHFDPLVIEDYVYFSAECVVLSEEETDQLSNVFNDVLMTGLLLFRSLFPILCAYLNDFRCVLVIRHKLWRLRVVFEQTIDHKSRIKQQKSSMRHFDKIDTELFNNQKTRWSMRALACCSPFSSVNAILLRHVATSLWPTGWCYSHYRKC